MMTKQVLLQECKDNSTLGNLINKGENIKVFSILTNTKNSWWWGEIQDGGLNTACVLP